MHANHLLLLQAPLCLRPDAASAPSSRPQPGACAAAGCRSWRCQAAHAC